LQIPAYGITTYHTVKEGVLMGVNQMLTVRIPEEDLEKLDQIAAVQGRSRLQLVQEALAELISQSENLPDLALVLLANIIKILYQPSLQQLPTAIQNRIGQ